MMPQILGEVPTAKLEGMELILIKVFYILGWSGTTAEHQAENTRSPQTNFQQTSTDSPTGSLLGNSTTLDGESGD